MIFFSSQGIVLKCVPLEQLSCLFFLIQPIKICGVVVDVDGVVDAKKLPNEWKFEFSSESIT